MADRPRVSVIVPVYDAGPYLQRCVDSLLAQTLPPGQVELIFVDDGSTDGSGERLDALAAAHAHVTVIHQENSGWPGKPRNVGMDAARGEYLFFADHDDRVGSEGLERMVEFASRHDADVLIPRTISTYGIVESRLFEQDLVIGDVWAAPVLESPTPHKMVRRALVETHGIRFPEGRRPLEDFIFVLRAFFAAKVIAILASYDTYYHLRRDDGGNAWLSGWAPQGYAAAVREAIEVIEANVGPGERRDALLERFARAEIAGRLRGARLLEPAADFRRALIDDLARVADDHIPIDVDARLPPTRRVAMTLLRARDISGLEEAARTDLATRLKVAVRRIATDDDVVVIEADAWLERDDGGPIVEWAAAGPRLALPPRVADALPPEVRSIAPDWMGQASLLARREGDSVEIELASAGTYVSERTEDGRERLRFQLSAAVEPTSFHRYSALAPGNWRIRARVRQAGYVAEAPLVAPATDYPVARIAMLRSGSVVLVVARIGPEDRLRVEVGPAINRRLASRLRRRAGRLLGR
jgi:poly(ribitol-phosphate) beta-N-acetylglucosaminyltransferase